MHVHNEIK